MSLTLTRDPTPICPSSLGHSAWPTPRSECTAARRSRELLGSGCLLGPVALWAHRWGCPPRAAAPARRSHLGDGVGGAGRQPAHILPALDEEVPGGEDASSAAAGRPPCGTHCPPLRLPAPHPRATDARACLPVHAPGGPPRVLHNPVRHPVFLSVPHGQHRVVHFVWGLMTGSTAEGRERGSGIDVKGCPKTLPPLGCPLSSPVPACRGPWVFPRGTGHWGRGKYIRKPAPVRGNRNLTRTDWQS